MSVLDEARAFEKRIDDRLIELEPLVDEYHELKKLKERLGIVPKESPAPTPRRTAARKPQRNTPPKKRRAKSSRNASKVVKLPPGRRQESVLEAIRSAPGITVPELGKQLDVDPTGLYRIVRRLEAGGAVRRDGAKAFPVEQSA